VIAPTADGAAANEEAETLPERLPVGAPLSINDRGWITLGHVHLRQGDPVLGSLIRRTLALVIAVAGTFAWLPATATNAASVRPATDAARHVAYQPLAEAHFSTFGTISTSGAVLDRFGVGNNFDALTFVSQNVGYGSNLFYFLRHDSSGFSTFGTISTSGAVLDRFGVGYNFDALTFTAQNVGYGRNLFYFVRHA
jgi:hypothetical protein